MQGVIMSGVGETPSDALDGERVLSRIGALWDKGRLPPALDERRISFGSLYFSVYERPLRPRLAALPPATRALDIGCGTGRDLVFLVNEGKVDEGLGVDLSTGSIEGAQLVRDQLCARGHALTFRSGTIDDVEERPFDLILAMGCLNYFGDPRDLLRPVSARLSPGGRVFLSELTSVPGRRLRRLRRMLRSATGRGSSGSDLLTAHPVEAVIAAAAEVGLEPARLEFAGFATNFLLGDVLHQLWSRRWRSRGARIAARWVYLTGRALVGAEDRLRTHARRGRYYYLTLTRVGPGPVR